MAQKFLVTEDLLKELGLTEAKLTTTILEEEYGACRKHFLQYSAHSPRYMTSTSSARFGSELTPGQGPHEVTPKGRPNEVPPEEGPYEVIPEEVPHELAPLTGGLAILQIRIDCEAISGPGPGGGSSSPVVALQERETGLPEAALVPTTSQAEATGGFGTVRKVLIVDTKSGSLIITVECSSLEILDGLWDDYCAGHLSEMAQKFLVTEDVMKELGVTEVKTQDNNSRGGVYILSTGFIAESCCISMGNTFVKTATGNTVITLDVDPGRYHHQCEIANN
ncbi:hypothetical protein OS493_034872 [Desmophyllum pertusum]|uniref:TRADD-like N-terminal domain-containing protein n=1 Tax=Desmophyllum pertusum TaxID=174260 RepID=A0A9W9ZW27_9CNID|nr:hypothetical protein OS493_034872 [Desmophyllum pertusum]